MNWFFFAASSSSPGYIYLWVVWRLLKVHSHSGWRLFLRARARGWLETWWFLHIFCMPWAELICACDEKLIPPNLQPCPSRGVRCNDCGQSWAFPDRWKAPWFVEDLCNFVEDCNLIWQSKEHFFPGSNEPFTMFSVWLDLDRMLLKMRYSNCQLTTRNECPSKEPLLTLCCDVESSCHLPKVILSTSYLPTILENPNIWSSLSVLDFHVLLHAFLEKIKQSIQLVPDNADLFSFLRFLFLSFLRAR